MKKGKVVNKKRLLLFIALGAVIIALAVTAVCLFLDRRPEDAPPKNYLQNGQLQYDDNASVLDPGGSTVEKVGNSYISLAHKNQAYSGDGESFQCYINNNIDNDYDCYISIYKDESAEELLYLSGLIPPGSGIDSFKSQLRLDKGEYNALLVITQVEEDHKTLLNKQLFLRLKLIVE